MTIRKKVIGVLSAAAILFGTSAPCLAAEGLTATVTTTLARGNFTYGNGGIVLEIKMAYTEKHPTTGDIQTDVVNNIRGDAYNTIAISRPVDAGYNYTSANFWGYAGGDLKATLSNVRP